VGMATKFTSCSLAIRFRELNPDGSASGGPMYYLEKGFAPRWLVAMAGEHRTRRWATTLGVGFALFALVASFGIGNMVQANSVVKGIEFVVPASVAERGFSVSAGRFGGVGIDYLDLAIGVFLSALVGVVIIGGIRRIARVASRIVPTMCVLYVGGALIVIGLNASHIPDALAAIVRYAFTPMAAGGGFLGTVVAQTMRYGVARGVFSNESGLGSAPIAHAAAKTKEMIREGFVAMLGPFIDTIVICTLTALVILTTDVWQVRDASGAVLYGIGSLNGHKGVDGALVVADPAGQPLRGPDGTPYPVPTSSSLTAAAFEAGLPRVGKYIVAIGLVFFAYSTMISWSYYGDRCAEFLFGPRAILPYRVLFVALIVVGAVGGLRTVWTLADILNASMAIPNLIGLLALSGLVARETQGYLGRLDAGEF
jgi:AGCS family alanine or glycine:cation symporter